MLDLFPFKSQESYIHKFCMFINDLYQNNIDNNEHQKQ